MATAADPPLPSAAPPPPPLPPSSSSSPSSSASPYPFAAAPDIVRAHQKDAYFTGHLASTLTDLHRRLFGARAAHAAAPELRAAAALAYLALTTLPGNRTLGEEYCDLVQVSARERGRLPTLARRAAYVGAGVLLPYLARRALPPLRARLRARLEALEAAGRGDAREARLCRHLAAHLLPGLVGAATPVQAASLALFYFRGTYYELAKRALGLRYVFTRAAVPDGSPDRAGYEVLGVLLVVQLAVRGWLRVREALAETRLLAVAARGEPDRERPGFHAAAAAPDVSLDHDNAYGAANSDLLLAGGGPRAAQASRVDLAAATHTPGAGGGGGGAPRFDLADERVMGYVKGAQQRKCTLCLEELKDPSATPCGHVFCWQCIGDWVREKPECPLCRRDALVQHILPLRVF